MPGGQLPELRLAVTLSFEIKWTEGGKPAPQGTSPVGGPVGSEGVGYLTQSAAAAAAAAKWVPLIFGATKHQQKRLMTGRHVSNNLSRVPQDATPRLSC